MRAVFVDRDGVLNRNREQHVRTQREFRFLPGALEALAALRANDLAVVVVTNQSAVGRGHMTRTRLEGIHRWMLDRVAACGGRLDAVYVCIHAPWEGCMCRKPRPGLLYQAAIDLGIDLDASFLIGDAVSDVEAAVAAGCQPILVQTGRGIAARRELIRQPARHHRVARDLAHAVSLILSEPDTRSAVATNCGVAV
jgi:D-glycero-D-manno-heptose 1,7-bisphosphate phosphatase